MAIYHFTTKIVKASCGKCAVASSAYHSGSKLYDERLGKTFVYDGKEEVIFSEVLLPENAPERFKDRSVLWNEVESVQNKANSRYARQFEFAVPNEWTRDETIERIRGFIQKEFVDRGMAVDYGYHEKDGNHHVHCMCTVRGFNKDGSWANMEKKAYALDDKGNKIPQIDPDTGEQKVRVRPGKGVEKLWVRTTVQANDWNKRSTLLEWRESWSDYCNQYLSEGNKIDHRSYEEQGNGLIPTIHEGYAARKMQEETGHSDRCDINQTIRETNNMLRKIMDEIHKIAEEIIRKAGDLLERIIGSNKTFEVGKQALGYSGSTAESYRGTGEREPGITIQAVTERCERVFARFEKQQHRGGDVNERTTESRTVAGTESRTARPGFFRSSRTIKGYKSAITRGERFAPKYDFGIPGSTIFTAMESGKSQSGIRELDASDILGSIDRELQRVNDEVERITGRFNRKAEAKPTEASERSIGNQSKQREIETDRIVDNGRHHPRNDGPVL